MKISETERKVLIIWLIIGVLVFLAVVLINIKPKTSKTEQPNTTPGENHVSDRIRYYTVKNAINKYYSYKNISDYDLIKTAVDNFDDKNVVEKRFTRIAGFTQKGINKIQKARKNLS